MLLSEWIDTPNLTYTELARRIGCSRPAVMYWATGQNCPTAKNAQRILDVTGGEVTPDDHQRAWELSV